MEIDLRMEWFSPPGNDVHFQTPLRQQARVVINSALYASDNGWSCIVKNTNSSHDLPALGNNGRRGLWLQRKARSIPLAGPAFKCIVPPDVLLQPGCGLSTAVG
jgi:hypothetical protein